MVLLNTYMLYGLLTGWKENIFLGQNKMLVGFSFNQYSDTLECDFITG